MIRMKHTVKVLFITAVVLLAVLLSSCEMFSGTVSTASQPQQESEQSSASSLSWPSDNELLAGVPAFSVGTVTKIEYQNGELDITVTGVSLEQFGMYVSSLKSNGFTDIVYESEILFSAFKKESEVSLLGMTVVFSPDKNTILFDVSKADTAAEESHEAASEAASDGQTSEDE
ncbi:MAG TPA: hypothetical protein PLT66_06545 [Bacillota bacterium]|nr:hypothetical protein [Bacillota bacterium]